MWHRGSAGVLEWVVAIISLIVCIGTMIAICMSVGAAGILGIIGIILLDISCILPFYWYFRRNYLFGGQVLAEYDDEVKESDYQEVA